MAVKCNINSGINHFVPVSVLVIGTGRTQQCWVLLGIG